MANLKKGQADKWQIKKNAEQQNGKSNNNNGRTAKW
jgi:hypothetical protein